MTRLSFESDRNICRRFASLAIFARSAVARASLGMVRVVVVVVVVVVGGETILKNWYLEASDQKTLLIKVVEHNRLYFTKWPQILDSRPSEATTASKTFKYAKFSA